MAEETSLLIMIIGESKLKEFNFSDDLTSKIIKGKRTNEEKSLEEIGEDYSMEKYPEMTLTQIKKY